MLPRRPVLLGGIVAPVLWTGLLHSTMGIVNPVLDEHIAWGWFLVSQIMFGIVAGLVVARQERIRTTQSLPFVMRMGIETPGLTHERKEEDDRDESARTRRRLSASAGRRLQSDARHAEARRRSPAARSVTDFATLYSENCAGCHGEDGQNGAALDLANPVYQAWVDDATLRKIIAGGEPGTQMPAFGRAAGGF